MPADRTGGEAGEPPSPGRGGSDAIVIGAATIVMFGLVIVRMIGLARAEETAAKRESVLQEHVLRTASEARLGAPAASAGAQLTSMVRITMSSPLARTRVMPGRRGCGAASGGTTCW